MSGDLDMASGVVDFRLIDPPRVTPKPVSPNRMALLPLALVVVGVAVFAFVWSAKSGQMDDLETPAVRMLHDDND